MFKNGRWALFLSLCLLSYGCFAAPAVAKEFPYLFEPELSLTGECGSSPADPIEDPGCPGGSHPPSGGFAEPRSIAIDSYGNEYVVSYAGDEAKGRIDVFDDEGFFVTELADPHGPQSIAVDSKGNLYAFEKVVGFEQELVRYSPSVYKPETGEIEYKNPRVVFATPGKILNGLAIDHSNDHLYVAQGDQLSEYGSATEGNKLLNTFTHPKLKASTWPAVDSQRRRLFVSYCKEGIEECGVLVFNADSPHELLKEIDGSTVPKEKFVSKKGWTSIAVDEETGHFFIEDLEASDNVYEFDEDYEYVATLENETFRGGNALQIAVSNAPLNPTARNRRYLFVPVLFPTPGRVLAFKPPFIGKPEITLLEATNVGETEAEVTATVDPRGGDTEYTIEIEGPGIEGTEIVTQGTILGTSLSKQVSGLVSGLEPGATYSIHAFAKNEADDNEKDTIFLTFSDAPIVDEPPCSNQALRSGASAALPDCRAYELVTPADTNGRPTLGAGVEADRFGMSQASPLGGAASFELTGGILPGTEGTGGFHGDSYRATRTSSGWSSILTGPTSTEASQPQPGSFSPDQGYSFFVAAGKGSMPEGRYVRYPDGHSEPIGRGSLGTELGARGRLITEDGAHIVFQTEPILGAMALKLEPKAPLTGIATVYDRTADEVTHVVSLLPGEVTPTEDSIYVGASADGEGIAFENEGTLYLRLNNATTFQIGAKGVVFAGVSEEGKRVFYLEGGDLLAFDTAEEKVISFTETGDAVPVNVAPSGTRAYFISEEAIAGQNPNGAEPQAGEQNLYLSEEGAISFVATVTDRDVEGVTTPSNGDFDGLGLWIDALEKSQPVRGPSRLTPEGSVFLFQSRANLDGYDSGGFPQIYRYDSNAEELECLSCPPTKTPSAGGAALQSISLLDVASPLSLFTLVPNLRADGARIFFESTEALVSSDTDEVRDVYEWEQEDVGSCKRAGGCIYLISSGHSARGNYLFGHSASGDDVFFTTGDVLVGGDEDTPSVYDARVGGGFGESSSVPCPEIDLCRSEATPDPSLLPPTTNTLGPDGNLTPPKRCPKGKHKVTRNGKQVCIKKKKHRKHKKHKANKNREAGK